ncbi:hypothetical protein OB13_02145 [Pontibacter sp. HJ8]
MSSANNHKRHTLEEEFQRRMHDAEASPAPDLWARIDHELTVQENGQYRKKVLFYRQLAAACFVLFMLSGALLTYHFKDSAKQGTTQQPIASAPGASTLPAPAVAAEENDGTIEHHVAIAGTSAAQAAATKKAQRHSGTAANGDLIAAADPQGYYSAGSSSSANTPEQQLSERRNTIAARTVRDAAGTNAVPAGFHRYRRSVSQSITLSFGSEETQPAQPGAGTLALEPKSFVELNKEYQAARDKKDQQQTEALAASLNKGKDETQEQAQGGGDSRWSLNLAYAPTYFDQNIGLPDQMMTAVNYRSFAAQGLSASSESFHNMDAARDEFEDKTVPTFSYTMEVKTGFKLKEKLKLLAGIGYSESSARTRTNYIVRQFWFKPRTNERYELDPSTILLPSLDHSFTPDSISVARAADAFNVDYKYRHLSIPVGLQFENEIAKDWFWYAAGGVAANFLLETSITASNQEVQSVNYRPKDEDSPFRKVQFSGNLSAGVGKRISDNLTVVLGPEVRNYFSTLVAEPDKAMAPQGKPYAFGLNMGLNYQLNNGKK